MDARVVGQLGVEAGREAVALADEHGRAVYARQHLDVGARVAQLGRADEHAAQAREPRCRPGVHGRDERIDLRPVRVAHRGDVDEAETAYGMVLDHAGQQDRARAVVRACTHWDDPKQVLEACRGLGKAMDGIEMSTLTEAERLANRGW